MSDITKLGNVLSTQVNSAGKVVFKIQAPDNTYRVFGITNRAGAVVYTTPKGFSNTLADLKLEALAARTARRHFRAEYEGIGLSEA